MRSIAEEIASSGPRAVESFSSLLTDSSAAHAGWAAHHLLELMSPNELQADRALAVIAAIADGPTVNADGERLWLDNWRRLHGQKG
jgi:hypothetical protein